MFVPARFAAAFTRLDRIFRLRERAGDTLARLPRRRPVRLMMEGLEDRVVPSRPLPLPTVYAGSGVGMSSAVKAYDLDTGDLNFSITAYDSSFTGGVHVATADFNADMIPDVVTGPGPGGGPHIRVFDGVTGAQLTSAVGGFYAYDSGFTGGVEVAAADVDGDAIPDVITAAGPGGGPHIRVFSGADGEEIASFYAYDDDFTGGIRVAAADFNRDGHADVIVGAGPGGGPHVEVFDLSGTSPTTLPWAIGSFYAYESTFTGGVWVGAGDVNGDTIPDVIAGPGEGRAPQVKVFNGLDGTTMSTFSAFDSAVTGGVRVGSAYVTDDGYADVVTATGPGAASRIRVYSAATGKLVDGPMADFSPFGSDLGGVYVGSANDPGTTPSDTADVTLDAASIVPGQAFRVSTDVTPGTGYTGTPTGSVDFYVVHPFTKAVTATLGTGTLVPSGTDKATATIDVTDVVLPAGGSYRVTAVYDGDTTFASSSVSVSLVGNLTVAVAYAPISAPTDCPECNSVTSGGRLRPGSEGSDAPPAGYGNGAVRLIDGAITLVRPDIYGSARSRDPMLAGGSWSNIFGAYNGDPGIALPNSNPDGFVDTMPVLGQVNGSNDDSIFCEGCVGGGRFYDKYGGQYRQRYGGSGTFEHDTTNHRFVLTDGTGSVFRFYDFSGSTPSDREGRLIDVTDAAGVVTAVTSWDGSGRPTELQQVIGSGGSAVTESLVFTFGTTGAATDKITDVTLRRKVGTGSWATVRTAEYGYYDGTNGNGLSGDLRLAVVKDAGGNPIDTSYYRYYTSGTSPGYSHGLKYALGPAAYGRLTGALGTSVDSLTDGQIDDYADHYLEFDSSQRVTKHVAAGEGCSVCAGGQGEYTYTYSTRSGLGRANEWKFKTVETEPDGNSTTYYLNAMGQVMLKVYEDAVTNDQWLTYHRYDQYGREILTANPSAVTGFSESYADLLNDQGGNLQYLSDTAGLIASTTYATTTTATSSTAGDVAGFVRATAIRQGETGTDVPQSAMAYIERTDAAGTDLYFPATSTVYRNDNGTGGQTTSTAYTWQGSTAQPASITTTLPTVTTAQNGPNTAVSVTSVLDANGRVIWAKDGDGFLMYTAYDDNTGAVTKTIRDVDTTQTSTFTNLPSGWSTPSGGGLHLTTAHERDDQGRPTKTTYPNGRIDYAVYDDDGLSVRYYPGWDTGTSAPTGPTTVMREDRAGNYTETLTMSATPAVSSGRPTGTESIGSVQSLSRTYRNAAGQTQYTDAYFDLAGLTYSTSTSLGTSGTNFYRTTTDHGKLGQVNRTVSAQGTIYRTEFDGLGRTRSAWVGTDDTPTTGYWSVTNLTGTNMVKVREYEYDSDGVGDGNLTKTTEYPGGGAADRVTQTWFDWRDRPVAVKMGVQGSEATDVNRPLIYTDYDNLGQATKTRTYDADTATPSVTSGVPQPLSSSLLRKQATADYDEWRRVYRASVYSVDPSSGSVGSYTLHSDAWYDKRGDVLKTAAVGGLVTKTVYDGARRAVMVSTTDGGGDSGWTDADDVTGDAVLEQGETNYDASGDVLTAVIHQRFHDETGTGDLGTVSSGVKARVSAMGYYYDKGDRRTDAVNVGTNGGSVWTRPGSVPTRSDTVLVTSTAYDAPGRTKDVTDPRGLVTRVTYDALGRVGKVVENYINGTVSDTDDKTTEYTYNATGMTSLRALLTGSGSETTQWVYGVTTSAGSGVNSNDIVAATRLPDPSTGSASSGQQDTVTFNALGQPLTSTDRNGSIHTYTYDVLGRSTGDAVTTLGSGVDGTVRRIATAFDGRGNPSLITSYDAVSSGSVVNQVQRVYNGLGQLITEYQAVSGAVNLSTSPKVQYTYSEMPSGANHSRLTSMTYPGGWVLTYDYGTGGGLNDKISRLNSLKDGSTTVEGYTYLGLATVVQRNHPEASINLSYVKLAGESNGAGGDQYSGLDRFGRIIDQRWMDGSGAALNREQYGYDRNGNRLYADNLVNNNFDELYHSNGASAGYDGLNQLSAFRRGALSDANSDAVPDTVSTATRTEVWTPDAVGNFSDVTTDGVSQARTHNKQNEITGVSTATTPAFDANGNMTNDEVGKQLKYNAWNRLVQIKTSSGAILLDLSYDGLGRVISENAGSTSRELYYTAAWQVIEEHLGGTIDVIYAWSPIYSDAMILRDRDTDSNGILDERVYVQQNAMWHVTSIASRTGAVLERYTCDVFGQSTAYDANYTLSTGLSVYGWIYDFQGLRYNAAGNLYQGRNRWYSPSLGRWVTIDPIRFAGGDVNLYRSMENSPESRTDPTGLAPPFGLGDVPANPEIWGWVICRKGRPTSVINDPKGINELGDCYKWIRPCIQKHENTHIEQILKSGYNPCDDPSSEGKKIGVLPQAGPGLEQEAYLEELKCVDKVLKSPDVPSTCKEKLKRFRQDLYRKLDVFTLLLPAPQTPTWPSLPPDQNAPPRRCTGDPPQQRFPLTLQDDAWDGIYEGLQIAVVGGAVILFVVAGPEMIVIGVVGAGEAAAPKILQGVK